MRSRHLITTVKHELNNLLEITAFSPKSLQSPNSWIGHLPFAAWAIKEISPSIFVELGTHSGNSYFAFCQSVVENGLSTKCYAVDTWQGDEHAGQYSEDIFLKVDKHHQKHYSLFSRLLRMTFDEAASYFDDSSIDLLHIDGLHTYDAVRHDFETWLPKLAPGAVVMFHDTNVREHNFGVWKLWKELQARYPSNLEYIHSHGLGVMQLDDAPDEKKLAWLQPNSQAKQRLIHYFAALGSRQLERYELNDVKQQISELNKAVAERDQLITGLNRTLAERDQQITGFNQTLAERDQQITGFNQTLAERDQLITGFNRTLAERDKHIHNLMQLIEEIHRSSSWRITAPIRYASSKVKNTFSVFKLLPDIIRVGGGMAETVKKAWRVLSREGWTGVKRRIIFVGGHRSVISCSKIKPEEILDNPRFGNLAYDPLVSVIAVNFNGAEFLPGFLKSLSQQSYRNFELIIVDNNSIDNSEEIINQCNTFFSSKIIFVKAGKNLGFAEGNNVALDYVKGELLALLNIDTHVHEDWLRELVEAVRIDKEVAIVASKILFWSRFQDLEIYSDQKINLDLTTLANSLCYKKFFVRAGIINGHGLESDDNNKIVISIPIQEEPLEILISTLSTSPGKIELRTKTKFLHRTSVTGKICLDLDFSIDGVGNAGFIINNAGSIADAEGMPYDRGFAEYDQGQYDKECYLPYFCGCAALIRRAAIIDRTIFVPEFFAYYEDSELSRWINSSGFKILYAPRSIVFHRHSATSSEGSPAWMYLVKRSQLIFKYAGLVNTLDKELAAVRLIYAEAVNEELMNILINYDQQLIKRLKVENEIIKRRKVIGIYNSYWNTLGGGESYSLSIAADLKQFGFVELISESDFDIDLLSKYFSIDLSKCRKLIIPNMDASWTERFFLFVNATHHSNLPSRATNSWYVVYFPHRSADKKIFESYFFLFISQYTKKWAKAYWTNSIHGDIVYPVRMLRSTENSNRLFSAHRKKKIILSVGRFNPNGHPKKQLEIAKVFRSLVTDMSDTNQWKLILAGSLDYTRSECVEYFDLVKDCLNGLDAELLPNLEREQLNQLFSEATIYVHATGLGCDKDSEPEKFEHFGITPLEAIQSGCIPVVLETGGPAELVRNLKIGYCFSSEESLRKILNKLIKCDFSVLINECKIAQERGSNFIDVESSKPLPVIPSVYHGSN